MQICKDKFTQEIQCNNLVRKVFTTKKARNKRQNKTLNNH